MGTLKTTLKVESTNLFPVPVNFTTVNNNDIGNVYSGFTNITVTGGSPISLTPVTPSVDGAYLYVQSPVGNTESIVLTIVAGDTFAQFAPGDVGFFPIGDGIGFAIVADTLSGTGTASLNYFVGLK